MNVLNFDIIDMAEARDELKAKFKGHERMIDAWSDAKALSFLIGDRVGCSMEGIERNTQTVALQVDSHTPLDRDQLMLFMDLQIIHDGKEFVFSNVSCEDECVPREYSDIEAYDARSWINVTYRYSKRAT